MPKANDTLTTGEVARICCVSIRTAQKWFDKGLLKGYILPGGVDRRIPKNELIRFMKKHDMPIPKNTFWRIKIMPKKKLNKTKTTPKYKKPNIKKAAEHTQYLIELHKLQGVLLAELKKYLAGYFGWLLYLSVVALEGFYCA